MLGKPLYYEMHDAPEARPGHDLRYALDGDKLRALGWQLPLTFWESLRRTIRWMVQNPEWLDEKNFRGGLEAEGGALGRVGAAGTGAGVRSVVGVDGSGGAAAVNMAASKL